MTTVAILEDDGRRLEAMIRALPAELVVVVFPRAPDMVTWLGTHLADCALISLDHDLVATSPGDEPGTGADVVDFLVGRAPACPVIVHSSNGQAAAGMTFELGRAGWKHERVVPMNDLEWVATWWARVVQAILDGTHRFEE